MTTIVTLETVWITYAADPTDFMVFENMSTLTETTSVDLAVRKTASGADKAVRKAGKSSAWQVTIPYSTTEQVAWLSLHLGDTMCFRDDRGNKVFGVYNQLPVEVLRYPTTNDTVLNVAGITYTEAVT